MVTSEVQKLAKIDFCSQDTHFDQNASQNPNLLWKSTFGLPSPSYGTLLVWLVLHHFGEVLSLIWSPSRRLLWDNQKKYNNVPKKPLGKAGKGIFSSPHPWPTPTKAIAKTLKFPEFWVRRHWGWSPNKPSFISNQTNMKFLRKDRKTADVLQKGFGLSRNWSETSKNEKPNWKNPFAQGGKMKNWTCNLKTLCLQLTHGEANMHIGILHLMVLEVWKSGSVWKKYSLK